MKAFRRSRGIAPLIINICSRWLWVDTKDYSWPWGPLSSQFSGYQRQFMVLGPTQPPIHWVPKTIHGPGAHSAPNPVGTKDYSWTWGPLSPPFSGYQRQFMVLGPTQPLILYVNLSLSMPWRCITPALGGGEWCTSSPSCSYPRKWPSSHRIGGWVDHRVSVNILEKGNPLAPTRIHIPDYLLIS
jgi:hypothetical protein